MSDNRKFQLNIKFGGGYEAPLLNIEGDNEAEFQRNVAFVVDNAEEIVKACTLFQAAYNVAKPSDSPAPAPAAASRVWLSSGSQATQAPAQAAAGQPDGPPPGCRHGSMVWKPPGVSQRTKRAYDGFWACPSPNRQDQCAAVNV
jgi:hypothetical protein